MLGPSVLVIPILEEGHQASTVDAYLPRGWWYPHYESTEIIESLGEVVAVRVPDEFHSIPILYRENSIIIRQEPAANTVLRYIILVTIFFFRPYNVLLIFFQSSQSI